MQRRSLLFTVIGLPEPVSPWWPLAIASSLWLPILLFGGALISPETARIPDGYAPLASLHPWETALVLAIVGFLSGSALPPLPRNPVSTVVLGGLLPIWGIVLLGYQLMFRLPSTVLVVGLGLAGLLLAFPIGRYAAPTLQRAVRGSMIEPKAVLSMLAIICALLSVLVPFAAAQPLTDPFQTVAPAELVTGVPQRGYALIKVAMLWVPLGFVFAAADLSRLLRYWVPAGLLGFLFVSWPFAEAMQASDLLEILGIPVGVWVGLWAGEQTAAGFVGQDADKGLRPESAPAARRPTSAGQSSNDEVFHPAPAAPVPGESAQGPLPAPEPRVFPPTAAPTGRAIADPPARKQFEPPARRPDGGDAQATGATEPAPSPALALPRPHPLALLPILALLGFVAWGWWDFPRYQPALGAALLLYTLLLAVSRHAWMVAIPALLPTLDLAPWTGRFFFDETDLFLLATLGAAALHRPDPRAGAFLPHPVAVLLGLFAATTLIALLVGLLPLSPLDANAFATYFSHYNALRVAKGFAWGLAVFLLLRWTVPKGSELPGRLLAWGLLLGLAGVILIGVRERWQFAALFDFSEPYRTTASFSSMHTGGSHLPAFLALVVPFVWLWVVRLRDRAGRTAILAAGLVTGLALFAGALYLVVSTVTRAAVLALAVELALLALFWLRGLRRGGTRPMVSGLLFAAMAAIAGAVVYLGTEGSYFQHRASMVTRDADIRLTHWRHALWMMDQDAPTRLFGMGLGSFPETYLQRNPTGSVPGNFSYATDDGNGYLLLGSGETLYLAQRVPVRPGREYLLSFDLKGHGDAVRLTMPLCEKHLLDSRDCIWKTHQVSGSGEWEHKEIRIDSGRIGQGGWIDRPPVELFLYNGEKDRLVAVDNLSLRDSQGTELLRNGDFSAGGDFWFFKTHDHLAWHIKNLWVSLLFEQGWAGLIAFNLLMLGALLHLFGPAWRGNAPAAAALTAIIGFLAVGLFASPFDAPRLTALFFTVLAIGLHAVPAYSVAPRTQRPQLRWRRKRRRKRQARAESNGIA